MTVPKVFIASSSEGLAIVHAAHKLLQGALGKSVQVKPWPEQFDLNKTYIESLESRLDAFDFSVLLLTPDDLTTSRNAKQLSPRDNVVFELGLFFGRLGRERCFILKPRNIDVKLPSDLLGIKTAEFSMPAKSATMISFRSLTAALKDACGLIAVAIDRAVNDLPSRPKLDKNDRAAQGDIRRFGDKITGTWWEQILFGKESALSLVEITLDDRHSSVKLEGDAYDRNGVKRATWRSAAARLEPPNVVYVRECMRFDPKAPSTEWLPGLGEIGFKGPALAPNWGDGKFWESDESSPEKTIIKRVHLKRVKDVRQASTFRNATKDKRRALARAILDHW